ncbi:alanyl-tRNA editing protein [Caldimonas tepidiphila]|uniref:alanyl-tRNA editing protein n=1 Tax=Caldimonas tepidiphila TaxID=2315841 RepID=UPI000E5B67F0|nr:alanyl-tRNA editing protein [Caldimonas tepidiphila]
MLQTELTYLNSDELQGEAEVLHCRPRGDRFEIVLDRTLFHPKGGGQPADAGCIGAAQVADVLLDGGVVLHVAEHALPEGRVAIRVDAPTRRLHSVLHSAGHLIGHAAQEIGLQALKAQHWPQQCRIVLSVPDSLPLQWQGLLQERVREHLAAGGVRTVSRDAAGARIVSFGALPGYACGGTHVRALSDIADIRITAARLKAREISLSYTACAAA